MTRRWVLPNSLMTTSVEFMRPHGARGEEGLALWFGTLQPGNVAAVSHVVRPYGAGFRTSPLHLKLSMRAVGQLTDYADACGLFLVGQIHSHPGQFVDLSSLDVQQGFRIPDFLSVVCPEYAQRASTRLAECGVHVFESGNFRRLRAHEIASRVLPGDRPVTSVSLEVSDD